ncbi:hypothetical protein Tco_0984021 [Tanacetum coccineum]
MESGENVCDNAKCEFQTKFVELEKVLTQQTKDFNDVKLELSNRTTKFEVSQTFEASSSQKSFKTSTFKGKNHVFVTPHSRFTPVKQVWRTKKSHSKSFKYSKSEMLSMQNKNDFASTINKKGRVSNETNFQDVSSNDINKWKSSSSTRFKTSFETPSFKNQWNIKRNFKSLLIPRELFSNETPVSSTRWNSTSLHRLDTTFNRFLKFSKPISTVLKWVPKVIV